MASDLNMRLVESPRLSPKSLSQRSLRWPSKTRKFSNAIRKKSRKSKMKRMKRRMLRKTKIQSKSKKKKTKKGA